jgi:hypothetical protein
VNDLSDRIERAHRRAYLEELGEWLSDVRRELEIESYEAAATLLSGILPPYAVWRAQQGGADALTPQSPAHLAMGAAPQPQPPPVPQQTDGELGAKILALIDERKLPEADFGRLLKALRGMGHTKDDSRSWKAWFHDVGAATVGAAAKQAGVSA